jgi:hypothetical protein
MKGVFLGCLVSLAVLVLLFAIAGSHRPVDYNAPGHVRADIFGCINEFYKYPEGMRFSRCMADKGYTRKSGCDDKDEAHCWEKVASNIK